MAVDRASRAKEILRWLAVLPGAFICAFLAQLLIHWIVFASQHDLTERDNHGNFVIGPLGLIDANVLEQLATAFSTPLLVIWAGAQIAPRWRFQTGIALAVILGIVYGIISTIVAREIVDGLYTPGRWLRLVLTVILCALGIAVGLVIAHRLPPTNE
jgi:hypothetical protein